MFVFFLRIAITLCQMFISVTNERTYRTMTKGTCDQSNCSGDAGAMHNAAIKITMNELLSNLFLRQTAVEFSEVFFPIDELPSLTPDSYMED